MHRFTVVTAPSLTQPDLPAVNRKGLVALGRGQPVVLVPGTTSSKSQWTALAQRLAPRFQAIAIDLHGFGDNRTLSGPRDLSIDDEIDLVLARLDSVLGCNVPVHLVGHSYGGLVALQFAVRYPALVRSLTLYEPMVLTLIEGDDPVIAGMLNMGIAVTERVASRSNFEAAQLFMDFWSGDGAFDKLSLPAKSRLAACAGQIALNFHAVTNCPLRLEELRALRTRTLLLSGARSHDFVQRIVQVLATTLPNSKVNWINADHTAPLNAPDLINPWIETFIETTAGSLSTGQSR